MQEYVELMVIGTASSVTCSPCIDIRGWIIDDNNGYHGSSGIASGCNRFSNNSFWSCIPLGTIITVYNGADTNIDMPVNDLDINDGNCRLVVPIENSTLLRVIQIHQGLSFVTTQIQVGNQEEYGVE